MKFPLSKKLFCCLSLCFFVIMLFTNAVIAKSQPNYSESSKQYPTKLKPTLSIFKYSKKITKQIRRRRISRKIYKAFKKSPPRDDLGFLKAIYVVAFMGVIIFALASIVMAVMGWSIFWGIAMITGGIIGVLPMLVVGFALVFLN